MRRPFARLGQIIVHALHDRSATISIKALSKERADVLNEHDSAAPISVPLSSVNLTDRERRYVRDAIDSDWISSGGEYVQRFETAMAKRIQRSFVAATSSGTSALAITLRALGIGPGDEVILPALTFAAPANAVASVGATCVFADVTQESWTIDPREVARLRTPRTRLLIAVDVLGHPCDFDALAELEIPILEDAAEAHGALYRGRPVGSFGIASIFSFHANKAITTGEGGCIATDDSELFERISVMNHHGMRAERPYHHDIVGHRYPMNNLTAAIGLAQVERWDELVDGRNSVSGQYDQGLADASLTRRPVAAWAREATWLHTITSERRKAVLESCHQDGIDARGIWPVLPDQPAFPNQNGDQCPRARHISARALWLPTWSGMPAETIAHVINAVRRGLDES